VTVASIAPDSPLLLRAFGKSHIGKVRTNNEDALLALDLESGLEVPFGHETAVVPVGPHGVLLAVSDGMGGHEAGEVASQLTLQTLRLELRQLVQTQPPEEALRTAVQRANRTVWDAAQEEKNGMGATLTAALITRLEARSPASNGTAIGGQALIAEVGDSRAYLLRQEAMLQLTRDQSYVQFLLEKGLLTTEGARKSPFKNVITQAMGIAKDVTPVLTRVGLRRGDRVLLCSDGLSNKVGDQEMHRIIYWHRPLSSACVNLIGAANQHGGDDNITAILFSPEGEGVPDHAADDRPDEGIEVLGPVETPIAGSIPVK
jgi:serine/threonine protein phosphatase PrpC